MPYTDKELTMAKKGYCYLKGSIGPRGLKKQIRNPLNYQRNELEFDTPAYDCHLKGN